MLRRAVLMREHQHPRAAPAEVKRFVERLAHALRGAVGRDRDAIDYDHQWTCGCHGSIAGEVFGEIRSLGDFAIVMQPMVPVLDQIRGRLLERSRSGIERGEENVAPGIGEYCGGGTLDRVARDFKIASRTNRASDRGEQESQIVVNLGDGADGRARVLDRILLAQRERGRNRGYRIDVRPLHPLQKQPRVSREALHVAALPLGVKRIEHQARFARARNPRDHGQPAVRQIERKIAEIVSPRPPNTD